MLTNLLIMSAQRIIFVGRADTLPFSYFIDKKIEIMRTHNLGTSSEFV